MPMSMSPVTSILRQATRDGDELLNVLTVCTHERYESSLAKTNCSFYAYRAPNVKDWNTNYAPIPDNYILLNPQLGQNQLPLHVDFDLVLSQNKFGQYQILRQIADFLHLPLVSLEHTLPMEGWDAATMQRMVDMRGDINVFISNYSIKQWGFDRVDNVEVIEHCVDYDTFAPQKDFADRQNHVLSVVNDWINRTYFCGFTLWTGITEGFPVKVVGDTPGLSKPAKSVPELVGHYADSKIFLNTSLVSPIPTALLEAMSVGCCPISTANCMTPEIIENGVNGFLSNDPEELRGYLELVLGDSKLAEEMGKRARQTIIDRFSPDRFIGEWDNLLRRAADMEYKGK